MAHYKKTELTERVKDLMRINLSVIGKKLSEEPVCDFCGDKHPVYVYRAVRMSTGDQTPCWRWCACHSCSTYIDNNNWAGLKRRLLRRLRTIIGIDVPTFMLDAAIEKSLNMFFEDAAKSDT